MKGNFQKILDLVKIKNYHLALYKLNEINNHKVDLNLLNLKGLIYYNLKEFKKSQECFSSALKINNNSITSLTSRARASFELGEFNNSIEDLRRAMDINCELNSVYENIGECYSNLGDNDKALKYYKLGLEKNPDDFQLIEKFTEKLTVINKPIEFKNKILEINTSIKNIKYEYSSELKIKDDVIKKLYIEANNIINNNFNNLNFKKTQIYRRNSFFLNCGRQFSVFNNFNIIPKFCFSCIKVTIDLDAVIDLIKLFLIFENVKLPNDNTRKCMIDLRSTSKTNYKGFIYCRSIEEAKEVKAILDKIIKNNISENLDFKIKRGCSEFNLKYPGFDNINENIFDYNPDWKKYEESNDRKFPKYNLKKKKQKTNNGLSLNDIMIMKNWLIFAYCIKDESCKKIQTDIKISQHIKSLVQKKFTKKLI
jgi:tetratricopeptide (TPR) repeat protein